MPLHLNIYYYQNGDSSVVIDEAKNKVRTELKFNQQNELFLTTFLLIKVKIFFDMNPLNPNQNSRNVILSTPEFYSVS